MSIKNSRITLIYILLLLLLLIVLSGCVSAPKTIVLDPDINETIMHYHKPVLEPDHINYSLTELYRGQMFFRLGDCQHSDTRYNEALKVMNRIEGDDREAVAAAINESARTFRGEPHERAAASLYRGICQYNRGNYESALSAFRMSLESDKETRAKKQKHLEDYNISHFLAALTYYKLGEPENAEAVLKLAWESGKENEQTENQADDATDVNKANDETVTVNENNKNSVVDKSYLNIENVKKNFIAVIETGFGPYLIEGPFWTKVYKRGFNPESRVEVLVDGEPVGDAVMATDLFEQADSQTWGAADSAALARGTGKFVVNVFVSALVGRDAGIEEKRDLRTWNGLDGLPGKYFIFSADLPSGVHTIGFRFYDNNGEHIDRYEQVWYEVPVSSENSKIFLARSMNNMHNVNGLELQSLQDVLREKHKQLNVSKEN